MGKRKTQIGCAVLVAILIGSGYGFLRIDQAIRNAYACSWVAQMVVEHMKGNSGRWPSSWDDLRDDYQTCVTRSGQPWSFAELSRRVDVDWQADPDHLLNDSKGVDHAGFRVITLSDGTAVHWEKSEPNQIVLEYLRGRLRDPE
jgi:hypothetical protein